MPYRLIGELKIIVDPVSQLCSGLFLNTLSMDSSIVSIDRKYCSILNWINTIDDQSDTSKLISMNDSYDSDAGFGHAQSSILDGTSPSSVDLNGPPSTLPRLATNYAFVKWTQQYSNAFIAWWNTTQYALLVKNSPSSYHLPSWDISKKSSSVWSSFDQAAEAKTGQPKVACRTCGRVFNHPSVKNTGTSNMSKHLKQSKCDLNTRRVLVDDTESISVSVHLLC
jgi:BED zinc finger